MTLVSLVYVDIRGSRGVKRQWGNRKHGFSWLSTLRFSILRKEANVIIYCYLVPYRLSADPVIYDPEWLK